MVFLPLEVQQLTPSAPTYSDDIDQTVDRSSNSFSNFIGWFGKIGDYEGRPLQQIRMITIDCFYEKQGIIFLLFEV